MTDIFKLTWYLAYMYKIMLAVICIVIVVYLIIYAVYIIIVKKNFRNERTKP